MKPTFEETLIENAKLREVLSKIGGFANSWAEQGKRLGGMATIQGSTTINPAAIEKFNIIEQTCKAALEAPAQPKAPLTFVMVGGKIYSGNLIDSNPEHFEGCVEIEVVDVDPTCARMRVIGTPTGKINEAPEIVEGVE